MSTLKLLSAARLISELSPEEQSSILEIIKQQQPRKFCLLSFNPCGVSVPDKYFFDHIATFEGFSSKKEVIEYLESHRDLFPEDGGGDKVLPSDSLKFLETESAQLTQDSFILVELTDETCHLFQNMLEYGSKSMYWAVDEIHDESRFIKKGID